MGMGRLVWRVVVIEVGMEEMGSKGGVVSFQESVWQPRER